MSLIPQERDENLIFEVTIHNDGQVTETASFETLEEAEMFAEKWGEQVPGARYEIEDRSHDHTAWEAAATDTALDSDFPPDSR